MALGGSSARRYAEALLEVAGGDVAAFRASLDGIAAALGREQVRRLRDRRIPLGERRAALEQAVAREPAAIRAVALLLLERDRIDSVGAVARAFGDLADAREGIVHAKITSPVELNAAARAELVARLERETGKKLRATFGTDPTLIGGLQIRLGDHLIDASVRAQLASLRARLARA